MFVQWLGPSHLPTVSYDQGVQAIAANVSLFSSPGFSGTNPIGRILKIATKADNEFETVLKATYGSQFIHLLIGCAKRSQADFLWELRKALIGQQWTVAEDLVDTVRF